MQVSRLIKIAFLFLVVSSTSFSQINEPLDYKITYHLDFKALKNSEERQNENMFLFVSKNYSKFISEGRFNVDSLSQAKPRTTLPSKFMFFVINELSTDKIWFQKDVFRDKLLYQEAIKLDWVNHQATKSILGYTCRKATTHYQGRNYTAWYTSEIPINSGPYKFSGLPGLILEIYDDYKEYHFLIKGIESLPKGTTLTFNTKNFINVSKNTYKETLQKFNKNPFRIAEQYGMIVHLDERQKKAFIKRGQEERKNKNVIELKESKE
ncbi:GLPGLI family protein [Winogradskyella immobilis]|uniref:GLPGLI family protein n=1 Tax=Winogradskyella immobilis TaxID=2816852 RepID=A0ABS8EPQ0_9FLAO|nr:GLPGLI family protein [Winogradskyella immobilis]MCC1485198.1 GLPGLI family protein [Winogradskyella immobilis]MCG0017290.1 GLPGLI family protein [Winogradskyella immobilis]